jgi:hypothetical protein
MDFIQSPNIFFGDVTLAGNPRPGTDFPRLAPFFNAPKANCSHFQFVIFSYPMGMDHIVLCNP